MGNSCGSDPEAVISKMPTVRIPVNILTDTLEISKSYLKFSCFSQAPGDLTVRFFVYEHGTVFIQDSTNPLPSQEYKLSPGNICKVMVRLNQAYIESFVYEPFLPWPIAIEAKVGEVSHVVLVEIREGAPFVIEKRVFVKGKFFRFGGIRNSVGREEQEFMKVCLVCFERERKVVGLPCNDMALCEVCAKKEQVKFNPVCPVCHQCK